MAAYCTITEARTQGAIGTDAEVTAAVVEASERVDRYTRTVFDTRTLTVETDVGADGYARLPLPALTVTAVAYVGLGVQTALDATAYMLSQSTRVGDTDSLQLVGGGWGYGLDTVVGMESYNRGSRPSSYRRRITVTGSFGRATVPLSVTRATAKLAAALTGGGAAGVVNTEGDVDLPPRVPSIGNDGTGLADADSLLRPYRRQLLRIS